MSLCPGSEAHTSQTSTHTTPYPPTAPMSTEKDLKTIAEVSITASPPSCDETTSPSSSRTSLSTPQEDAFQPPDGGLEAWSQALAGCLVNMLAWGFVTPIPSPSLPPPSTNSPFPKIQLPSNIRRLPTPLHHNPLPPPLPNLLDRLPPDLPRLRNLHPLRPPLRRRLRPLNPRRGPLPRRPGNFSDEHCNDLLADLFIPGDMYRIGIGHHLHAAYVGD